MFHMTQTQRNVLGSIILALTMTFGSMSAHASLVSYNVIASPFASSGGTTVDITIFIDDAGIPATGTHQLVLSSVDVIISGPFTSGMDEFFTYTNTDTSPCTFGCSGNHVLFTAIFTNGNLTGDLMGLQPGPGGLGIARSSFENIAIGNIIAITYFDADPEIHNKNNGQVDRSVLGSFSGPFAVSPVSAVPLPAALPLFGSALAMLGIVGWRRKRWAAA